MQKHVLITGAGRGLGHALAQCYLDRGHIVYGAARDPKVERLQELVNKYGDQIRPIKLDVKSEASVAEAAAEVARFTGHLDIIINNAAISKEMAHIQSVDISIIEEMMQVNTLGPLRVSKHFVPMLESSKQGVLINITSEFGSISEAKSSFAYGYFMSKAALNMQSKLLHNDLSTKNIKVLAIHPGWMRTDMGTQAADLAPMESAEGIAILSEQRSTDIAGPIFMDHLGNTINW